MLGQAEHGIARLEGYLLGRWSWEPSLVQLNLGTGGTFRSEIKGPSGNKWYTETSSSTTTDGKGSDSATGAIAINQIAQIGQEQNGAGGYFKGRIDEVRIWDLVRTPAEIAANRSMVIPPSTPGLVAYWRLDDGPGSNTAAELVGGKNGTLQNMEAVADWLPGRVYEGTPVTLTATDAASNSAQGTAYVTVQNDVPAVATQPANASVCAGASTGFTITTTGTVAGHQWQVDPGTGYVNLANGSPYSGVTTATLAIDPAAAGQNGFLYRCVVTGACATTATSNGAARTVNSAGTPVITAITDVDGCAQNGIQVAYTAGAGATSHNLLKDGTPVVTGYVSGATYHPGDTSSHSYVVRAVSGSCSADSIGSAFSDTNTTPPSVGTLTMQAIGSDLLISWTMLSPPSLADRDEVMRSLSPGGRSTSSWARRRGASRGSSSTWPWSPQRLLQGAGRQGHVRRPAVSR